mmetsp:Transcript_36503/g.53547  ORF Transcript_36503/g.53547 Transcript_36503/m.53547 type:complete len:96 (+) Transcript_36503:283-570(+)
MMDPSARTRTDMLCAQEQGRQGMLPSRLLTPMHHHAHTANGSVAGATPVCCNGVDAITPVGALLVACARTDLMGLKMEVLEMEASTRCGLLVCQG